MHAVEHCFMQNHIFHIQIILEETYAVYTVFSLYFLFILIIDIWHLYACACHIMT